MGLLIVVGPALLTLIWLGVVIWLRRVPLWLIPGLCGFSIATFFLGIKLLSSIRGTRFLGHETVAPTPRQELIGNWSFYLFTNSFFGVLWCAVLAVISLPIGLLLGYRRRDQAALDIPMDMM